MFKEFWNSQSRLQSAEYWLEGTAVSSAVGAVAISPWLVVVTGVGGLGALILRRRRHKLEAPRRLLSWKRARIVQSLLSRRPRTVQVWYVLGNAESEQYANDIISAFEDGDWNVIKKHGYNFRPAVPTGLKIAIRDQNKIPPGGYDLVGALEVAEIAYDSFWDKSIPENEVHIYVGTRD